MRQLSMWLGMILLLINFSCQTEDVQTEDLLINDIMTAVDRQLMEPADLPADILRQVSERYFETYLETAWEARERGFEINLGDGENLFFNRRGELLDTPDRNLRGACARVQGRPVGANDLPTAIRRYLAAEYPERAVVRAKWQDGEFLVALRGGIVLRFDRAGAFLGERSPLYHCQYECQQIRPVNLPDPIHTYIAEHYPDAAIRAACGRRDTQRIAVFLIRPEGRAILIFDTSGNLLRVRD